MKQLHADVSPPDSVMNLIKPLAYSVEFDQPNF